MCYDTLFHEVATRKEDKYMDLLSAIRNAGYNAKVDNSRGGITRPPQHVWVRKLEKVTEIDKNSDS